MARMSSQLAQVEQAIVKGTVDVANMLSPSVEPPWSLGNKVTISRVRELNLRCLCRYKKCDVSNPGAADRG